MASSSRRTTGQRAAIKFLLPVWRSQERVRERFAREARVLMRLSTPHVGQLLDVGNLEPEQGDLLYLVLEYLGGEDLQCLVQRVGRYDVLLVPNLPRAAGLTAGPILGW